VSKKRFIFILLGISILFTLSNCFSSDVDEIPSEIPKLTKNSNANIRSAQKSLPVEIRHPKDNLSSKEKVDLGRLLFFDPILSGDKDVACATCHHPEHGYAEFRDISIGVSGKGLGSKRAFNPNSKVPFLKRNSQTILNTAYNGIDTLGNYYPEKAPMFWDLRANSLESQAIEPILTFEEMRGTRYKESEIIQIIIKRLSSVPEYVRLFDEVFSERPSITEENLGKALATFERSLTTPNSRFDRFMNGETNAISKSEENGLRMFNEVGCANCHSGPMFSDYLSHTLGVPGNDKLPEYDKGVEERYAFRTPSLRNLRFTAPYMHNGNFTTLKEVLEFYFDLTNDTGIHNDLEMHQLDTLVEELTISMGNIGPIISFLNTLDNPDFDKTIRISVPSGLEVGGNIGN